MGSKIFGIKGEPKFALQNFEVGGSVLVEKMHTPETKKCHFLKMVRLSCNFMHKCSLLG